MSARTAVSSFAEVPLRGSATSPAPTPAARRRGTLLIAAATLVVIAGAGGAAALALRGHPDPAPRTVVAVPAQQPAGDPVSG